MFEEMCVLVVACLVLLQAPMVAMTTCAEYSIGEGEKAEWTEMKKLLPVIEHELLQAEIRHPFANLNALIEEMLRRKTSSWSRRDLREVFVTYEGDLVQIAKHQHIRAYLKIIHKLHRIFIVLSRTAAAMKQSSQILTLVGDYWDNSYMKGAGESQLKGLIEAVKSIESSLV
ncbi:hypothetical protein TELCIR_12035 [Teladorsagia circumcincta]|uniref:Uncharacterized protein n=1 Tax=Teladorsagia circumcincta TaxID=45464 RepID=A0A2G9U7K2_TELCI|nr:hypothetical protein TELCIR_12035 [Teladorsagia circumcincta]